MLDNQEKEINKGQKFCTGRIVIIAILAAILLPALNSARARGRAISCLNNLKQYGTMVMRYADAYDSFIVGYKTWDVTLRGAVKWNKYNSIATYLLIGATPDSTKFAAGGYVNGCPERSTVVNAKITTNGGASWTEQSYTERAQSYGINQDVSGTGASYTGPRAYAKLGMLKNSSKYVIFADARYDNFAAASACRQSYWRINTLHSNFCNAAMLDGSARSFSEDITDVNNVEMQQVLDPSKDPVNSTWLK